MRRFQGVAALLFASAAGCGKTTSLTDATTGDATSADSGTGIDAVPAGVTVITYSRECCDGSPQGTVAPGVSVYTVQPSGEAGPTGQTDANGKVVLAGVEPEATITAVYQLDGTDVQLATVVGVKPGDTISLGAHYYTAPPSGNAGLLTVNFPSYPGATYYQLYSSCAATSGATSPLQMTEQCVLAKSDLLLIAYDDSNNGLASGTIKDVTYTDGQTAALSAWTPAPAGGLLVSITGLIANLSEVDLIADIVFGGYAQTGWSTSIEPVTTDVVSAALPAATGGDRTYLVGRFYRDGYGNQETYAGVGPTLTAWTFAAPGLPWLSARALDVAGQSVSWTQTPGGSDDGEYVTMWWSRTNTTTDTTTEYKWSVLLPPGRTEFQWGTPIPALAPYVPVSTDDFESFYVQLIDFSDAAGYDQLRAAPEWQWAMPGNETADGGIGGVSSVAYGAEGSSPTGGVRPAHPR